jgi:hypothetical protein
MFRIFRVFRILRIYKSLKVIQNETIYDHGDETSNTLKLDPIKLQFVTITITLMGSLFIGAGLVLGLQDLFPNAWSLENMNFFDAIYFIISSYTTVGFGDIIPTHITGRFLIIMLLFCLIIIVSDQIAKLANLLNIWGPGWLIYKKKGHLIVVCDSTIFIDFFIKTIKMKYSTYPILIISNHDIKFPSKEFPYNKVDVSYTSNYDFDTFERSNTRHAKAIFLFTKKTPINSDEAEKITDFLILKIKRYYSHIPIYVQTLFNEKSQMNMDFINISLKNEGVLIKFEKIIPILSIKSQIIAKSTFNPGFATFAQNLIFNDYEIPSNLGDFSPIMMSYLQGCENKIKVKELPKFFDNKSFFDICLMIYCRSIRDYFTKITTVEEGIKPILLIGMLDKSKKKLYNKEQFLFFPYEVPKHSLMNGIFITSAGDHYLGEILNSFEKQMEYKTTGTVHKSDLGIDVLRRDRIESEKEGNYFFKGR